MCVLPQNQDYYVFDHHHAALRRVLCNYWEDGVSRVEDKRKHDGSFLSDIMNLYLIVK